ncbi:Chondroitin synthase [Botrimarina colliarenosi]|uniref:Chondroitin synthase n=1 Tax=Botrimarina colliarenosi TaxID=2528001 RepID=A0A5C6AEW6_9BACT|nr:glycosyltransferase family 2 protein [Botrimarina colliarenosi]TWT97970.1 Chondroitin synthase [Botrimarina colliarenosi]
MKISVVIPNYNGAEYLGRTIESVLAQTGPEVECLVFDGGSTDGSVDILRHYEPRLAYWESQPDRGQSHAINKGLARANGEIVNWLCSDDELLPGALETVAAVFREHPDCDLVAGRTRLLDVQSGVSVDRGPDLASLRQMPQDNPVQQPSCFYRRSRLRNEAVREDLHYTMDLELWCHFSAIGCQWRVIDDVLSLYRMTGENKTSVGGLAAWSERKALNREYGGWTSRVATTVVDRVHLPLQRWRKATHPRVVRLAATGVDKLVNGSMRALVGRPYDSVAHCGRVMLEQSFRK